MFTIFKRLWGIGLIVVMAIGIFGCREKALPYHAEIIGNGTVSDMSIVPHNLGYFTETFWRENTIGGIEYTQESENSEDVFYDDVSPTYRVHIVANQETYYYVFMDAREIDFEKSMVLIYLCGTINDRLLIIKSIQYEEKTLKIEFTQEKGKAGYKDTCAPKRRFLVIKIDKLDVDTAHFIETK